MTNLKVGDIVIIKDLDEKEYSNSPLGFVCGMRECVGKKGSVSKIFHKSNINKSYCTIISVTPTWFSFYFFIEDLILYNSLKYKFKYILTKL